LCGSLSGHYYIGKHAASNLNDHYCGSGKILKDYYSKYGRIENETFLKEILEFTDNEEHNCEREREILGTLWKQDPNCLNLKCGGSGGSNGSNMLGKPSPMRGRKFTEASKKKLSEAKKGKPSWIKGKTSPLKGRKRNTPSWNKGKSLSEEHKKNLSESHKGKLKGKHWRLDENKKRVYY
jgi:hypothetical protein